MSLDVPERRGWVYDLEGDNPWQHRLLIRRLDVGAVRWVVITPDHAVEAGDLSTVTVRALPRNTVLPEDCVDEGCYAFDPFSGADMLRLRAESGVVADVLGAPLVEPNVPEGHRTAIWIVSDTGDKLFNMDVPTSVTGSVVTFTFRQHAGIACIDGDWMSCEFVKPDGRSESIMRAVSWTPHAPDLEGLVTFLSHSTATSGVVVTLDFDRYVAGVQKADAAIIKPSRMMKEEQIAAARKKKDGSPSAAP